LYYHVVFALEMIGMGLRFYYIQKSGNLGRTKRRWRALVKDLQPYWQFTAVVI
jgi:hypothetical protein